MLSVEAHKLDLPVQLVPIRVVNPQNNVRDESKSHPSQLQVIVSGHSCLVCAKLVRLDDRQTDVEERDRTETRDQRHKEVRRQPYSKCERYCVEELDLNKRAFSIDVELGDAEHVLHYDQEVEDEVRAAILQLLDHVDCH